MAHAADYAQVKYIPMILQYYEILQYHFFKSAVYGTLPAVILQPILGLFCDKTYGAMMNYNNRYYDVDNGKNKDGKYDKNAASGSGSDGMIFDPTMTPWYRGGGSGDNSDNALAAANYVSTRRTIYIPYKDHIKDVPQTAVCKNWAFGLVLPKHEKYHQLN